MARKVTQMPPGAWVARYPWDEWFDGSIWELARGEDFPGDPRNMGRFVRNTASRKGFSATVRVTGDKVYLQARPNQRNGQVTP